MTQSTITAGDATANSIIVTGGDDGTLALKVGAAGAKVNAVVFAADGTPTQIKGTTVGSAPTPVPGGSAPLFSVRAWCKFAGSTTGTAAPTQGGNVASITKVATGVWTINFTTPMPDTDYAISATSSALTGNTVSIYENTGMARTTSSVTICNNGAGTASDPSIVSFMLIR